MALLMNTIQMMMGAFLICSIRAGFTMVEARLTRAKDAGSIIMKNMVDFMLGSLFFFIIGFAIMLGGGNPYIGTAGFFNPTSLADTQGMINGLPIGVFMIFRTVFCTTAATIMSGAMAKRTKLIAYLIYSAAVSIFICPVSERWVWGGGWLTAMGFHDLAGSTAVHMVDGVYALVSAKILGPRLGKYKEDGIPNTFPGHNIPMDALGMFILWFCWFGFSCDSTTAVATMLGDAAMTTDLTTAAATLVTLIFTWVKYGKPDIFITLNGALAGLVAVTTGRDVVTPYETILIGAIAGIVVVLAIEFVDEKLKIDDPVGIIGVHGYCGSLGTVLTGVFGGGCSLTTQLIGACSVLAFVVVMAFPISITLDKTVGLRVGDHEQLDGLDLYEHGITAYVGFRIDK